MADLVDPRASSPGRKPRSATNSAVSAGPHARAQSCWATEDSARWMASAAASRSTQASGRHSRSDGAAVHGIGAEDPAQLGQQRVEPGIDGGRVGFPPQRLGQLVPRDLAVPVDDQVREQQPALAAGQPGVQALAVALDGELPADLDPHGVRDAKVTPTSWQYAGVQSQG